LAGLGLLTSYAASSAIAASRPSRNVFHALTVLNRPARLDRPVTVQVGRTGALVEAGQIIALERGYFAEQGINVEYVDFDSAARMIPSLGVGQLDVGAGTVSAGLFNAVARGIPLKMVGPQSRHDPGASSLYLMVRKDLIESGQVTNYADLRGRRIATPALGIVTDFIAAKALTQGGLQPGDAELVEMGFPDMIAAFANRAIDAAVQVDPTAAVAVNRGLAVKWHEAADLSPGVQAAVVVYSPQFAQQADVGNRWMLACLQGVRAYNDAFKRGIDREGVVAILAAHSAVNDTALYDQMGFSYIDPNGRLDQASLIEQLEWHTRQGFVTQPPNVRDAIDMSFADFAVAQLGWYE
jgi:NitT/TauT family transport system substrate-binding protein